MDKTSEHRAGGACLGVHGRDGARPRLRHARLALLASTALVGVVTSFDLARAQTFTWNGSTATTPADYNTPTNWTPNTAAPTNAGQSATFDTTGNTQVNVSAAVSPVSPDAWTFTTAAQSYTITGNTVTFGGTGITNNAANSQDIQNNISGTGGITQAGSGALILQGKNDYTGATSITAGYLTVNPGGSITQTSGITADGHLGIEAASVTTTGDTTVGSGAGLKGTVYVSFGSLTTSTMTVGDNGSGTLQILAGGTVTVGGGTGTLNMATEEGSSGTLIIGATPGTNDSDTPGTLNASAVVFGLGTGSIAFNHNSSNYTFAPSISGGGSVVVDAGTTILTGTNSYTQGTVLNGGILGVGSASAIGTGQITFNGGTLQAEGDYSTPASANGEFPGAGGTIDANGHTFTFAGNISGFGPVNVESTSGAGTVVFSGSNTYEGPTYIGTDTTLQAGSAGAFSSTSQVSFNASTSTLDLNGHNETVAALSGTSGTVTSGTGPGAGAATLTIAGAPAAFGGVLQDGTGALSLVMGSGIQVLTGTNTYSGGTTIQGGVLSLSGNSGTQYQELGTGGVTFTGGTLALEGSGSTFANNITVSANDTGTITFAAGQSNVVDYNTITLGNGSTLVFAQSGDGGTGVLQFNSTPGMIGTGARIEVGSGYLLNQSGTFTQFSSTVATTQVDSGATLDLAGYATTILSLAGAGTVQNDGNTTTIDGTATGGFGGKLTGTQDVTFTTGSGTGSSVLTAVNDYTGATTISGAGTKLEIASGGSITQSASLNNSGTLQVDAGGSVKFGSATNSGTIINNGTFTDAMTNTGTITNAMTYNGDINNMSPGTITNTSTGTWNGDLLSNNSMVTNQGTWNSNGAQGYSVNNNGGTVDNQATWTDTKGPFQNQGGGTFENSTTASILNGGLTNAGTTMAEGQINGTITNSNQFTVTGALTNDGSAFNNNSGGALAVGTNSFTGIGALTNAATVTVGTGGVLGTATIDNSGMFTTTGTVNTTTGFTNEMAGTVNAQGTMTGNVTNNGAFNLTGNLGGIGTFAQQAGTLALGANTLSVQTFTDTGGTITGTGSIDASTGYTLGPGTYSNGFGGTGSLTPTTGGTVVLAGMNTYSGGTFLPSGTEIQVTNSTVSGGTETSSSIGTGPLTFEGGTLQAGANNLTFVNATTMDAPTSGSGYGGIIDTQANTLNWNGVLTGSGSLDKIGSGTLALGGASNNWTGNTTVDGGTISIGANNNLGAPNTVLTLNNGTGITFTGSFDFTHPVMVNGDPTFTVGTGMTVMQSGPVTGTGDVVKDGGGTFQLTDPGNTYSGSTTVNAGTLEVTGTGAITQSASLGVVNGATFQVDAATGMGGGSATFTGLAGNDGTVMNAGTLVSQSFGNNADGVLTSTGTFTTTNANGLQNNGTANMAGTLNGIVANANQFNVTAALTDNGSTFNNNTGGTLAVGVNSFTGIGALTNTATVTVGNGGTLGATSIDNQAGGTLTSTGTITATNGLTNEGTVNAAGAVNGAVTNTNAFNVTGALADNGSTFANNGGTLAVGSNSFTGIGALTNVATVTVGTGGLLSATSIVNQAGGTLTWTGTVTTANGLTNEGTVNAAGVVNGAVTNTNAFNLTGNLRSDGSTFANNGGTLAVGANSFMGIGALTNAATVTVGTGGMLGAASIDNTGTFTTTGTVTTASGFTNEATGTVNAQGTMMGNVTNKGTFNLTGTLSGIANFDQTGGTLALGTNTLNVQTFEDSGGTITGSGTINASTYSLGSGTYNNIFDSTGALTPMPGATVVLNGANTYSGGTYLPSGTTIVVDNSTVTGGMETSSSIGTGTVNFEGGTLQAGANNLTFVNATTIGAPTDASLGPFGGIIDTQTNTLTWNGAISGTGSLDKIGSGTLVLGGASTGWSGNTTISAGTLSISANDNLGQNQTTLTLGNNTEIEFTNSFTFTHPIVMNNDPTFFVPTGITINDTGPITGNGDLVKTGGGTFQLSNTGDSYTGMTDVNGGTLEVTGAGAITQSSALNNNATFLVDAGGAATFTGASTNAAGATLTNNGSLTAASLTNAAGGTITSTGTLTTTSGLTNSGTVNANGGAINGAIANNAAFNVGGTVTSNSTFNNASGATLAVSMAGNYTISGLLTNGGTITIAAGGTLSDTTGITNNSSGTITNDGTVNAALTNSGTVTNNSIWNGDTDNLAGSITNNGTWNGNLTGNTGLVTNNATWNATNAAAINFVNSTGGTVNTSATSTITATTAISNAGTFNAQGALVTPTIDNTGAFNVIGPLTANGSAFNNNGGTLAVGMNSFTGVGTLTNSALVTVGTGGTLGTAMIANQAGATFTSTGTVTTTNGFTNDGTANFAGTLNGPVTNEGTGAFTITGGNLLADSTFTNNGMATLAVSGGNLTGVTTLTNNSTSANAVSVAATRTLQATTIINNAGVFTNAGTVTAATIANNSPGTFTSTGTVTTTGGFTNSGLANFAGTLNSAVTNTGTFTVTGALADNGSAFANNAGGTLAIGANSFTNIGTLTNDGNVTIGDGGTLGVVGTATNAADGTFTIASGTGNAAVFNNAGTIKVANGNAAATPTFNTPAFNNSGTINMANGVVGDVTTINGTYNATGGATLAIDENLTFPGSADRLVINGAGTGNTVVNLNASLSTTAPTATPGLPTYVGGTLINPTPVVVGGAGATFVPTTGQPLFATNGGVVQYSLVPVAGGYDIVSSVNTGAIAPLATSLSATFSSITTSFFQPISAIIVAASGDKPDTWTGGPWIRFNDSSTNTRATGTDSVLGISAASDLHTDARGLQGGYDTGAINIADSKWNAHVGLTAGTIFADAEEKLGPPSTVLFNVPFVGTYAAVRNGTFSADLTYLHDFASITVSDPSVLTAPEHINGTGDSITGNAAYGFNIEQYSIEPALGLSYAHFKVDTLAVTQGTAGGQLNFNKLDSLLGRFGVQFGRTFQVTDAFAVKPFTTLAVWHEFEGNTQTAFSDQSGTAPVLVSTTRIGTFGQASIGIAGQTIPVGLTTFARFDVRFGDKVDGVGGSIGGRYSF